MRLTVGCIGKLKKGPEAELCARYAQRFTQSGRGIGFTGPQIVELPESRADQEEMRKSDEADRLRARLPDGAIRIAFDERGKAISSRDFAATLRRYADSGTAEVAILIGGPDGLDTSLRDEADEIYAFGRLTMPHQIVRILVMEQLYRAVTILTNHPYHRD